MNKKAIPITMLRDTGAIDELVNNSTEPIYVTKNGHDDFVLLPKDFYEVKKTAINKKRNDNFGYVRVQTSSIKLQIGDVTTNTKEIISEIERASKNNVSILVFQELALVGASAGDLVQLNSILYKVEDAVKEISEFTKDKNILVVIGAPLRYEKTLVDAAICIFDGKILGVTALHTKPNKWFTNFEGISEISIGVKKYPFGSCLMFENEFDSKLRIQICSGEDLLQHKNVHSSASIVIGLGCFKRTVGSFQYLYSSLENISKINNNCLILADSNCTESTNDSLFGIGSFIAENGTVLSSNDGNFEETLVSDIDLDIISKACESSAKNVTVISFQMDNEKPLVLKRKVNKHDFLPQDKTVNLAYVKSVVDIQATALASRMRKINSSKAVLGLSGGLDSALALIVTVEAFKKMNLDVKNIYTFSLPCFGTTNRTKSNSEVLARIFGVNFKEVNIGKSVNQHLADLEIDDTNRSVAFENAQARERTQFLMDYANLIGGLVVGTGDLSELALGWCTYNGDHMSMYSVNCGIFKTMVRYIVKGYSIMNLKTKMVLEDILDTPISPELLPGKDNKIEQKTENIIGPYELQDFYIYNFLKYGYEKRKLLFLAKIAFEKEYTDEELNKWLDVFFRRFFTSQFKRSAVPDGPQVLDISLSPRGSLIIPSDLSYKHLI